MRRILFITVVSALGLMLAPSAIAATKTVTITSTGFSPATVSIVADDSVVWRNSDSRNHQVVAASGAFASPILRPGQSFRFTFSVPGTYGYRDALFPSRTGSVKVAGPPPAVTLAASQPQIQFGQTITLTGQVNNKKAGEQVLITAQPYGQLSSLVLATVLTGTDGTFTLVTKPQILTIYRASWKGANSIDIATGVAPVITFGRSTLFVTRVYAGRSMAGKVVQVQRLSSFGQWVTVKRVLLRDLSRARFRLTLPKGVSKLRVAMSVNQAGVGYLPAFSREITIRTK